MKVAIIGGGVGGLSAALCLDRLGIRATVFEAMSGPRDRAAGLSLLPEAVRVLGEIGLGKALVEWAVPLRRHVVHDWSGRERGSELRGLAAGAAFPELALPHERLQRLLLDETRARLGAESVLFGHHLAAFDVRPGGGVAARFIDRHTGVTLGSYRFDLLVGADGVQSVVRHHFHRSARPPRWSGNIVWRGITQDDPTRLAGTTVVAEDGRRRFACFPVARWLVGWAASLHLGGAAPPRRAPILRFLPAFAGLGLDWLDPPALIRRAGTVYESPEVERDAVPRLRFGPVTLIGDAAHPLDPATGASRAILDARALAGTLATSAAMTDALTRYEHERLRAA